MIVEALSQLPTFVYYEQVEFELVIYIAKENDIRLFYRLIDIKPDSKHFEVYGRFANIWLNHFTNSVCNFLYLEENIENDEEFLEAIERCKLFLTTNNLSH